MDEALERLGEQSERLKQIAELRFFGGLSREEIADLIGSSRTSVARDWRAARAMLATLLETDSISGWATSLFCWIWTMTPRYPCPASARPTSRLTQ